MPLRMDDTPRDGHPPGIPPIDLVREIWADILGLEAVGPDDDFFALGGSSLIVVSAVARLAERTGVDLPLRALFEAPTPAEMAELLTELRCERHPESEANGVTPFMAEWVVPLQREGDARPVFVFPAGPDDLRALAIDAHIASLVGRRHPFWGFRRDDVHLERARQDGIPMLVAEYVKAMRQIQGRGPFLLFGNCVGGYLAWEAAGQLLAAGEEVAGLLFYEVPLRHDFDRLMPGATPRDISPARSLSLYYRPRTLPVDLTHLMTDAWQIHEWSVPWRAVVGGRLDTVVISPGPAGEQRRDTLIAEQVRRWIEKTEARPRNASVC
jgi:acyl carrier protein